MKINDIYESTTAGSVATVAQPMTRKALKRSTVGQGVYPNQKPGKLLTGKETNKKYANSISESPAALPRMSQGKKSVSEEWTHEYSPGNTAHWSGTVNTGKYVHNGDVVATYTGFEHPSTGRQSHIKVKFLPTGKVRQFSNTRSGFKEAENWILSDWRLQGSAADQTGNMFEALRPEQRAEEIKKIVSFIVSYIGDDPSNSAIADAAKGEADRSKAEYDAKRSDGFLSPDDIFEPLWKHFREPTLEASSPAQQAAIAINMKKKGQKPKNDVQEDYTGEFAAEKTPAINPYGGRPDRQFRGAISETPNTSGPIGTQPGGWRTYKATPAGEIEEDTAYAGGMGQGGDAGQSYRKFTPKMAGVIKKESSIMKGLRKEGR